MTYRDDLEAAQARTEALEQEVAEVKRRNAELEAANARHERAPSPRIQISDSARIRYRARARRVLKLRLIATIVIIAGIVGSWFGLGGEVGAWIGLGLIVSWFVFVMPGEWQRRY